MNDQITYSYFTVANSYVVITSINGLDDPITFATGKEYIIDVPETIDGLPVLHLCSYSPKIKTEYAYSKNNEIILNLPEHTSFFGFDSFFTASGYRYPSYRILYYPRTKHNLFVSQNAGFRFIATNLNDVTCKIIYITQEHPLSHFDIMCKTPLSNVSEIIVPGHIEGHKVVSIGDKCTYKLPDTICSVIIADETETIGNSCFMQLPNLQTVELGKSLKKVDESSFSYHKGEREEYVEKLHTLIVYCHKKPDFPESAFLRGIDAWEGEEYQDWGWMKTGSHYVSTQTVFKEKS